MSTHKPKLVVFFCAKCFATSAYMSTDTGTDIPLQTCSDCHTPGLRNATCIVENMKFCTRMASKYGSGEWKLVADESPWDYCHGFEIKDFGWIHTAYAEARGAFERIKNRKDFKGRIPDRYLGKAASGMLRALISMRNAAMDAQPTEVVIAHGGFDGTKPTDGPKVDSAKPEEEPKKTAEPKVASKRALNKKRRALARAAKKLGEKKKEPEVSTATKPAAALEVSARFNPTNAPKKKEEKVTLHLLTEENTKDHADFFCNPAPNQSDEEDGEEVEDNDSDDGGLFTKVEETIPVDRLFPRTPRVSPATPPKMELFDEKFYERRCKKYSLLQIIRMIAVQRETSLAGILGNLSDEWKKECRELQMEMRMREKRD